MELIKGAWKEIEDAEEEGLDVDESSDLLKDARNKIKDGKFEIAAELAMNAIQLIKKE